MFDERAEEIFADALDVDASAQQEFLDRACGGDAGLRAEVEGLLADAEGAETFFKLLTGGAPGSPKSGRPPSADRPGCLIGSYRLVRPLGRGGFGFVWLAEQEHPIQRQVAIKLIKRGMDSEEVLARFDAERQALALMEHPNIARVFDAGTSADGRPYFAMELVRGDPVTKFSDTHNLDIRARIGIFLDVCAAVNHAHQKGVIHRDLKPSNVLVGMEGGRPLVKVIDFGIAKAVSGHLADQTLLTRAEQLVGTPAYMSPEQAGLGGIDTRCDVYALGVILYELLTGVPPFDQRTLARAGHEEIRRIIREVDPPRPSSRLTSMSAGEKSSVAEVRRAGIQNLERLIAAELDWIVMKAIEKDRVRRYETADALAVDLERFLADEPVSARPPSAAYLFGKFARRHRGALAAGTGILVLLLATTAISLWLAVRATTAEQLAEARLAEVIGERNAKDIALQDAEAVSRLVTDVFQRPLPNMDGRTATVADALDLAAKNMDKDLSVNPSRRALLKEKLAESYQALGLFSKAITLRQQVLEIRRDQLDDHGPPTISTLAALAENYFQSRQYDEALAAAKEALRLAIASAGETGEAARVSRKNLENLEKKVVARKRAVAPAAGAQSEGAVSGEISARHAEARESLKKLDLEVAALRESRPDGDPELAAAMERLASEYYGAGFRADAVRIQEEIVEMLRRQSGEDSPETIMALDALAYYLDRAKHWGESRELREKVVAKQQAVFGRNDPRTLQTQTALALQLFLSGEFTKSLANCEEAVARMRKSPGPTNRATLNAIATQARCYAALGRTPEALHLFAEASPHMRDDTFVNFTLAGLQLWFGKSEDYAKTRCWMLDYARESANRMRTRADILNRAILICSLAPLDDAGQGKEMLGVLKQARNIDAAPGAPPLQQHRSERSLLITGIALYRAGDLPQAEASLRQAAVELSENGEVSLRQNSRLLAELYLAMTLHQMGKTQEAQEHYLLAKNHIPPIPSAEHPLLNNPDASGEPIPVWLAFKEAKALLGAE